MKNKKVHKNPWTILSKKKVYENPWIELVEFEVLNPKKKPGIYGKIHFKGIAVGVIAIDKDKNIYLVGQYRFPLNEYSWEIPEGGADPKIPLIESAKRELKEETGILAKKWIEIQRIHTSNSATDELGVIYLATGLSIGESEPEDTEELKIKKVAFEDALKMVLDGSITDSLSVASILKLDYLIKEGKLKVDQ